MSTFTHILTRIILIIVFVGGIFGVFDSYGNQTNFFSSHHTNFLVSSVHAEPTGNPGANSASTPKTTIDANKEVNKDFADTINSVIQVLNAFLGFMYVLVTPLVALAGWFMSPDWVTGDMLGLRESMFDLWVTISNVVYFIYAILLIVIAVMTIFNSSNWGYKQMLPKLFLGILLVPFTWWFVQWMVSISTSVTAAVLEIPAKTITAHFSTDKQAWWNQEIIPKNIEISTIMETPNLIGQNCDKNPGTCVAPAKFMEKMGGLYGVLLTYAFAVFKIQDVKVLEGIPLLTGAMNIFSVALDGIFSSLIFLIFTILVVVLLIILFIRAFKIWIWTMFSPLFTLKIIFNSNWDDDNFDIGEFFGTIFMPAVIGVVLSFGLLVVSSLRGAIDATSSQNNCTLSEKPCVVMNIMAGAGEITQKLAKSTEKDKDGIEKVFLETRIAIGEVGFTHRQLHNPDDKNASQNVLNNKLSGVGTIIIQFIALIFIWVAFLATSKLSKAVGFVMEPLKNATNSIKSASQTSIRMVPLPGVGNLSGIEHSANAWRQYVDTKNYNKAQNGELYKWIKERQQAEQSNNPNNQAKNYESNKMSMSTTQRINRFDQTKEVGERVQISNEQRNTYVQFMNSAYNKADQAKTENNIDHAKKTAKEAISVATERITKELHDKKGKDKITFQDVHEALIRNGMNIKDANYEMTLKMLFGDNYSRNKHQIVTIDALDTFNTALKGRLDNGDVNDLLKVLQVMKSGDQNNLNMKNTFRS